LTLLDVRVETVLGIKVKMLTAIVVAALLGFLMLGLSYVIFPEPTSQEPPRPMPTTSTEPFMGQILWTIQWVGLAAVIAITVALVFLLVNRAISKRHQTADY